MSPTIGIDLGTSFSRVAIFTNNKIEVISNDEQNRFTASYVAFKDKQFLVGESAKIQSEINPSNSIFDLTRLIGRKFDDKKLQAYLSSWPFEVISSDNFPRIEIIYNNEKKFLHPMEVTAMILLNMKKTAETYIKNKISKAVITVPTYFNSIQRKATKDAANIAGFLDTQIINSSTAVAIAYGFHSQLAFMKNVFIFDMGGGALSVSIVKMNRYNYKVISNAGNTYLGGENFDNNILNHFVQMIKLKYKKDISSDKFIMHKLKNACEHAKKMLTGASKAHVQIEQLVDGINFDEIITRNQFEQLNVGLFKSITDIVEECLFYSNLKEKSYIDEIIICGGSSRIPKIQELLQTFFNNKPLNKSMISGEAPVYGAAVKASIWSGLNQCDDEIIKIIDITSFSIRISEHIGRRPLTTNIIDRNTKIPQEKIFFFRKIEKSICFNIYERENQKPENYLLGRYTLSLAKIRSPGFFERLCFGSTEKPIMAIKIQIDLNGIIEVDVINVSELSTRDSYLTENERRLTKRDIDEMKIFAETCRHNDEKRYKADIAKNDLELYCSETRKFLSKNKEMSPEIKQIISKIDKIIEQSDDNNSDDEEIYIKFLNDVKKMVKSVL